MLTTTPSRELNGRRITSYDDRFILTLASKDDSVVVSNDKFKDLVIESADFKATVAKRQLFYTFAGDR